MGIVQAHLNIKTFGLSYHELNLSMNSFAIRSAISFVRPYPSVSTTPL